ncbi:MAG TPA: ERCC4 domain-containing protein [archaeon]|nr:ERCC4 domain-containing protein [archaeon]
MPAKVVIFVDTREVPSGIIEHFGQYDCTVQKKMLPIGDFLVSDRIVIEKKTGADFAQSIIDQRLFTQLKAMKENFEKPVIIIEGGENLYERLHPNTVRGALASITLDAGVPILWSRDVADTAGLVYWIARREQIDDRRELAIRAKNGTETMQGKQEFLITGLPDISNVRARALLEKFKTPDRIFAATEEELKKVEGIGPKIAKRIRELLETDYSSK